MPTKIEWTDETWNLINGCTVVSPGCTNCYAMRLAATRHRSSPSRRGLAKMHKGKPQWTGEILFNRRIALDPFRWAEPRRIFVCAHGDLFHKDIIDQWIDFVFFIALICPQHTFQILTKRAPRMREYMRMVLDETEEQTAGRFAVAAKHAGLSDHPRVRGMDLHWPPRNVWLGTSVEDQERANERVPQLLAAPAAVRWLSCEPLLGPVDLTKIDTMVFRGAELVDALTGEAYGILGDPVGRMKNKIDWVVVGGESGPGSRPMHPDWLVALHDQCEAAGTPFMFKQWGDHLADQIGPEDARSLTRPIGDVTFTRVGKKDAGRKLFGIHHDGYPA